MLATAEGTKITTSRIEDVRKRNMLVSGAGRSSHPWTIAVYLRIKTSSEPELSHLLRRRGLDLVDRVRSPTFTRHPMIERAIPPRQARRRHLTLEMLIKVD